MVIRVCQWNRLIRYDGAPWTINDWDEAAQDTT